jgi:cytochrome c-type biogenesis protein CcmH/NrfG
LESLVEQNLEVIQSDGIAKMRLPGLRVYTMAAICLCAGLLAGWVIRGPQRPSLQTVAIADSQTQAKLPQGMPTEDHMKRMAEKQAAPLIEELKDQPNDATVLAQIARTYFNAQQMPEAISYYERAVQADPKRVGNRADLASYLYLNGEPDKAIQQLEKALSYEPNNPQVLFNLGMIRLKAKSDKSGAVELWTRLLKNNKNLPEGPKQRVQKAIAEVKQRGNTASN